MKKRAAGLGFLCLTAAMSACGPTAVPEASSNVSHSSGAAASHGPPTIRVTKADVDMGQQFLAGKAHVMPVNSIGQGDLRPDKGTGYPLDVALGTGPTMPSSKAYNVYVNCANESCWGYPEEFLTALPHVSLARVVTQYTGSPPSAYQFSGSVSVKYSHPYSNTYYNEDLFAVLAAAVRHFGQTGLQSEYHIFLRRGVDTCFDRTAMCYSPNEFRTFKFCAYHSFVNLHGQTILYSVEPYQETSLLFHGVRYPVCYVPVMGHGVDQLDSATASTLSHESFESWSDPEPNTGWFNSHFKVEIGDACAYYFMAFLKVGGENYFLQKIYSNKYHGCADKG